MTRRSLAPNVFAAGVAATCLWCLPAFGLSLTENGKALAKIYIKADAPKEVQDAAADLAKYLGKMSGGEFPVEKAGAAGEIGKDKPGIVLGVLAEELGLKMEKTSTGKDGFRYKVAGKRLLIVGESPKGVTHGVFDLLATLGCGWYVPGKLGEVIPSEKTIALPDNLDRSEVSDSFSAYFWYGGGMPAKAPEWWTDMKEWTERNKANRMRGCAWHMWGGLVPSDRYFKAHPEYFSLVNGKRKTSQLCTTNPEVAKIAAASLLQHMVSNSIAGGSSESWKDLKVVPAGPNDGGGLCECPECAKLDTAGYIEPASGGPVCSDRVFRFMGDMAEITSKQFPDRWLGCYVYSDYSRIPKQIEKLHPNVFPMIAPILRCRFHGPGNPICKSSQLLEDEIRRWTELSDGRIGLYLYNFNLADCLVPFSKISYYKRILAEVHHIKPRMLAWDFESAPTWAISAPSMYLSVRLSWDSHLDVDAAMDRFYQGFYQEAAAPMRGYWERIDQAYAATGTHTGCQYGLHHIWTDGLLADSRKDIEEAKRLAQSERVRQAVAMAEAGLRSAELFMLIRKKFTTFDFLAAEKLQKELQAHQDMMFGRPSPLWTPDVSWTYYKDLYAYRMVESGAKVVRDGGKILVRFHDVWKTRKDENLTGVQEGWWKPELGDGDWQDFATFSKSWDDQGLGSYHKDLWYRTKFTMPKVDENSDLRLWFGGFDYNVDVYLNGQHLGEQKGFATPKEFAGIGKHLKPGVEVENVLAVRVSAGDLAELGTGGIMMPVMIYASAR